MNGAVPSSPSVRTRSVALPDGTSLAVQETGPPDAPPLLLLQGQANSHDWWTNLRDAFDATCRTITFDYRGTGATDAEEPAPSETGWSTSLFAEDALAVLRACGATSARVYGTSMGGRIAQLLAIQAPEAVERLVLACTSPGGTLGLERDQSVRRSLAQPEASARRDALLDLMYTPAWARPGRRSHLLGDRSMSRRAQQLHLRVSGRHDAADRLHQITAPTLVLHGSDDRMAPADNATLIADRIPGAVTRIWSGGRHGFFDEFHDDVSATVRDFFAG